MYYLITNKFSGASQVVPELSDFLFEEGWRCTKELQNNVVNIHVVDENERQNSIRQYGF
jgi:hypothetical protein